MLHRGCDALLLARAWVNGAIVGVLDLVGKSGIWSCGMGPGAGVPGCWGAWFQWVRIDGLIRM